MKKIYIFLTVAIFAFMVSTANAQNGNGNGNGFDQLIKSSPGDATKLVQNFAEPLFKGFGIGLNSGWNNTAKTKKFLHFDLRITANVAQVPTSGQSFDVTKIGLSNHVQVDPSSTTNLAPTFAGSKSDPTPLMDIKDNNGNTIGQFNMPNGVIQYIPAPNIQLTVGLLKNTDLTIRTTPNISIGSNGGSVGMIGFGIKHDIIQDFLGKAKVLKPFDLAIAVNYNRINYSATLNVQPEFGTLPAPGNSSSDFSNQRIKGAFTGVNVQAIISKKLLFFTPFLSVGYQSANTAFNLLGNYPVSSNVGFYSTITDPVHISENSISGLRTDIGFQLNLSVFRIFASYSPGQYQSANAGIGFGF
ncbi:MAG: hypothetical protein JWQ63_3517 [Mucilaginibacter sp.]|nr:hypothetical protein [Mucilaginibacter sp.]